MKITLAHGSGGKATSELIEQIFATRFSNPVLNRMEDSAVVPGAGRLALTTDSFVVSPLFFPGGDIGKLAVCGTVNDLLMSGAKPKYLTCGFILEEGVEWEQLEKIVDSMAATAAAAGVSMIAGDTKVIEGSGGVYINTAGVGFLPEEIELGAVTCREGDAILLSGNLGDHHAAIMSARMGIENEIRSDCAPLNEMVRGLLEGGVHVRVMRDVTRGGLATILHEFSRDCGLRLELEEPALPVSSQVKGLCGILGLDPLYMGNEGKLAAVVAEKDAEKAVKIVQNCRFGENAAIIGHVSGGAPGVFMKTEIGGTRVVSELYGEGLPRIC